MIRGLYTAERTRAIDRRAIRREGVSGLELMARAADAVCRLIQEKYPEAQRIAVYAGVGNNAGDGYLVARRMKELGKSVLVTRLAPAEALRGDAKAAFEEAARAEVPMREFSAENSLDADLIVDALLGTGLSRSVEGDWAKAIDRVNASGADVISVDVPSGLNADTGVADPHTALADRTVTLIARKRGLYTADGPDFAGRVEFDDLGIRIDDPPTVALRDWTEVRWSSVRAPQRIKNSHKGDYGHVLVIGGSAGYQGAAELCGAAALRCGSGLVSLVQPPDAVRGSSSAPELMRHEASDSRGARELAERASVIAIGPGLGRDAWARDMLGTVLESRCPMVLDADALRLLAADPWESSPGNRVLTPHPGEAAALLGGTIAEIQEDRFSAVRRVQETYGGVVVLKGCGTLVADARGEIGVCAGGNPGMATAGMGDVLTGVIASLIGQAPPDIDQADLGQAALAGVCMHAEAGDRARERGMRGMIASDLLPFLRELADEPKFD